MGESVFDKKRRVRPPRVNISYEVELNGAKQMKELPFVVGVLGDLSGQSKKDHGKLKDRKFVEIDRDNFDDILKSLQPRVAMKVDNKLKNDGSELSVELNFEKLADFSPDAIVQQVEPLKKLLEMRNQLKDLQSRTEGNDRLEELLDAIIQKPEVRDKLKEALGAEAASLLGEDGGGDEGGEG
ncbi:MAG: type VI secretion system contractile sheath small subunit [Planctomycetota bacterium]